MRRLAQPQTARIRWIGGHIRAGSGAAAVTERRLQREHIDAAPDRLRGMCVAQLVWVKVHAGLLAPAAHPVGDGLPRQVAVSARRWKQPGIGCAAAKRFE